MCLPSCATAPRLSRRHLLALFGTVGAGVILAACTSISTSAPPLVESTPDLRPTPTSPAQPTLAPQPSTAPAVNVVAPTVQATSTVPVATATAPPVPSARPSATATAAVAPAPRPGGILTIGTPADANTLDPHKTTSLWASRYLALINDNLVDRAADGTIKPGLAEEVTTSPDGLTYTFKIRTDVKFHSGKPLTAEDVKYTLERWLQMPNSPTSAGIKSISSIEVPNAQWALIRLNQPNNVFLDQLAGGWGGILNKESVEKAGGAFGVSAFDGTGPYRFKSWSIGQTFQVERNPDYRWGGSISRNPGPAYLDGITFRTITQLDARVAAFTGANIFLLPDPPPQVIQSLGADGKLTILTYDQGQTAYLGLNVQNPILSDPQVRRAISGAIDRVRLINEIAAIVIAGEPAANMIAPATPNYSPEAKSISESYTPIQKAKQLLEGVGWTLGPDGIRRKNGQLLTLPIAYNTADPSASSSFQSLQTMLKEVGIQAVPGDINNPQVAFLNAIFYESADVLRFLFSSLQRPAPNRFGWSDPTMDRQFDTTLTSRDPLVVRNAYFGVQKTLAEQVPAVPLYHQKGVIGVNNRVQGLDPHPVRWIYKGRDLWLLPQG